MKKKKKKKTENKPSRIFLKVWLDNYDAIDTLGPLFLSEMDVGASWLLPA